MDEAIERVIEDLTAYTEAAEGLITQLQAQTAWNSEDIARLRAGSTLAQVTTASGSADRSLELTRVLDEFGLARRRIRTSVSAAALAEGLSILQIGEIFGVSRQLANRFVKEARLLPPRTASGDPDAPIDGP